MFCREGSSPCRDALGNSNEIAGAADTETDAGISIPGYSSDLNIVNAGLPEEAKSPSQEDINCKNCSPRIINGDVLRVELLKPDTLGVQKPFRKADSIQVIQYVRKVETV